MQARLQEGYVRFIFKQITLGVKHMHDRGVVHRDLKPDNIMFSNEKQVKIVDFGLALVLGPGELATIQSGSIAFSAPEVHSKVPYDSKADIWSLGAILYFMLTRTPPFIRDNCEETIKAIIYDPFYPSEVAEWMEISSEALDLVTQILSSKDPNARLDIN